MELFMRVKYWYCCCCVASVVSDSVRPHRRQPTRLPVPGILQARTQVGCHFLLQCMKVKSESEVAQSCSTLATAWTVAHQAPPSMGFSRQKYWSGVPLPSLNIDTTHSQINVSHFQVAKINYKIYLSFHAFHCTGKCNIHLTTIT